MAVADAGSIDGGTALVRALERNGVRHVFGIPGDHTLPIYRALAASSIEHVTVRHEQGAGFMADGYGRASGRPGVAVVVTGPGVGNIATAMAEATTDSAPVIVVSADVPLADVGTFRDHNHELRDQRAFAEQVTLWSARATSVAGIGAAIDRAFATLADGAPGAIHVGVPIDVLSADVDAEAVSAPKVDQAGGDRVGAGAPVAAAVADIDRAAALLDAAERPLLILGGGTRHARAAVRRLVDRLGAPVLTTWNGKGVLGDDHPLNMGSGLHLAPATELMAAADVVLAAGTRLGTSDFWFAPPRLTGDLIRLDIDADAAGRGPAAAVRLVARADAALDALADAVGERTAEAEVERAAAGRLALDEAAMAPGRRYRPWLAAFREALPPSAALAVDSTTVTYLGFRWLAMPAEGRWLYPSGFGTLGYALPAAIGSRVAEPDRPAAVLIGDGGLLFTCPELLTATERGLALPVLLWNDRGYGSIRLGMRDAGMTPLGTDFAIPDVEALARAFGAAYARPRTPAGLATATRDALDAARPTIIDVDDVLAV